MTVRYVGPGGNDGNSGLTWALRKLTLNGVEDTPVVAGDVVYVGPGVYRETLTCDVSGGNTYSTGTVSVTNGSDQVTGAGTAWLASVAADYMFHVRYYDNGADGVTNGTSTFTAAGGNFQANMVGVPIQINTKGAYTIATRVSATEITLADPNGLGWPTTGSSLTYSVMSGEGHYDIESVDADGTLTLKQPWQGRTLTGLSYLTFNPITYIGDVTGENTDGIGGIVRITGSDNDQTAARGTCISIGSRNYRVFRSFQIDTGSSSAITPYGVHTIVEDCAFAHVDSSFLTWGQGQLALTFRRNICLAPASDNLYFGESATVDDTGHVVENCIVLGPGYAFGIKSVKVGGITIRNCLVACCDRGVGMNTALAVGQTILVNNSILVSTGYAALYATTLSEITENYNTLFNNSTDRANTAVGANSVAYTPLLLMTILHAGIDQLSGFKFPWRFGELSEWSQIAAITGVDERNTDLFGIRRPATASKNSWGPIQFVDMELEDTTVQAGSYARALNDAGQKMARRIPCTAVSTTVTLYVRRQTNYAGSVPRMVIKQPGQADRTTDMTAAVDTWEQLSDTFTPAATPGFFEVWAESRNTATSGSYKVFYDTLGVS